jgi:hypothetical protein
MEGTYSHTRWRRMFLRSGRESMCRHKRCPHKRSSLRVGRSEALGRWRWSWLPRHPSRRCSYQYRSYSREADTCQQAPFIPMPALGSEVEACHPSALAWPSMYLRSRAHWASQYPIEGQRRSCRRQGWLRMNSPVPYLAPGVP